MIDLDNDDEWFHVVQGFIFFMEMILRSVTILSAADILFLELKEESLHLKSCCGTTFSCSCISKM